MLCTSVREGVECSFMSKKGCEFINGSCHAIIPQCEGCQKAREFPTGVYCLSFPEPESKWRTGVCNMATHLVTEKKVAAKVNPLKASKRKGH